jgi:hypothetical protein
MRSARAFSFAVCTAIFGTFIFTTSQGVENAPMMQPVEPGPNAVPAPIMIGTPIFYDGPMAGRYPNAAWVRQINDALATLGYQHIESCKQRTNTSAFAYMVGCSGRFQFVSDMYLAAASVTGPIEPEPASRPQQQSPRKPGERVADIVDTTVPLRIKTYGAAHEMAAAASRHEVPIYGRSEPNPFVDPALSASVPRTASRSAVPQLLPTGPVSDPFPGIANASAPPPRATAKSAAASAPKPKVVTVESPEKIDRPRMADFADAARPAAPATASNRPVNPAPTGTNEKAPKRADTKKKEAKAPRKSKVAANPPT